MKPNNRPLEFLPPPNLYVLAFFLYALSVLLALRLDRSSAITKVTGSIPAEYIKVELFVVNSQWGRICKKKHSHLLKRVIFAPPPPPKKVVEMGIFPQCVSVCSLALQLDCSSATTEVMGSIPAEYVQVEFFVVNSQWGRFCNKKNIPIIKKVLFRPPPPPPKKVVC